MLPDTRKDEKEQVKVSNEFGRLHFKREDVPRPSSDYGWNGESLKDFRRADQQIHDDHLQQQIIDVLSVDLNLDLSQVDILVNDGQVNLAGKLGDPVMNKRAEEMIKSLPGVKGVQNDLT